MVPHPRQGTFPLFKFRGIQVSFHWSWLVVAWWQIDNRGGDELYPGLIWPVCEYLALFGIVLLHEFGHAFATRRTGGTSENILLWPFGGIAYVKVPPRPRALLWAIAAGPLVNAALLPVLWGLKEWGYHRLDAHPGGEPLATLLHIIHLINYYLLLFNLLPVYPLDGGQILHALLWMKFGYVKALHLACAAGLAGGTALTVWMLSRDDSVMDVLFTLFLAVFLLSAAWRGFNATRKLLAAPPGAPPFSPAPPPPQPVSGQPGE